VGGRLGEEVLAAAEPDLEPKLLAPLEEQGRGIDLAALGQGHPQAGQKLLE
jgi:hypothetical protein